MRFPICFLIFFIVVICFHVPSADAYDSCVHNGIKYRHGDEWIFRRSFIMSCYADSYRWEAKVIACLSLMGQRIPIGGQVRDRHGVWKCIQDENAVRMVQEP